MLVDDLTLVMCLIAVQFIYECDYHRELLTGTAVNGKVGGLEQDWLILLVFCISSIASAFLPLPLSSSSNSVPAGSGSG